MASTPRCGPVSQNGEGATQMDGSLTTIIDRPGIGRGSTCGHTDADQLSAANAAFERGAWRAAAALFEDLAAAGHDRGFSLLQLGRATRRLGETDHAIATLHAAEAEGASATDCAVERILALYEAGRSAEATTAFLGFCANRPLDLPPAQLAALLPPAHVAYLAAPAAVLPIYQAAVANGSDDYLAILRIAELDEREGRLEDAAARIAPLGPRLDHWGRATLARIESRLGRIDAAAAIFQGLCSGPHADKFLGQYLDFVLAKRPDPARLAAFVATVEAAPLDPQAARALRLRAALLLRDAPLAHALVGALLDAGGVPGKWQIVDLLYLSLAARHAEGHQLAATLLSSEYPTDPEALEALTNRAMMLRDWDAADRLLDCLARNPKPDRAWVIALKRFELACYRNDLAAADALVPAIGPIAEAPPDALPSLYRYHAERQAWNVIVDDARARLVPGFAFARLGDLVVRAARKSGRGAEVLGWLDARPDALADAGLARVYFALGTDTLLRDGAGEGGMALLSRLASIADDSQMARLNAFRRVLPLPAEIAAMPPLTVFFCTNRHYLTGTAVALATMLSSNPELRGRVQVVVCADAACLPQARAMLDPIAHTLGAAMTYLEAERLCGATPLKSSYGLFTGGHALTVEAYWRLYVARWLARTRQHRRAIYLDSDVAIGPRFLDILEAEHPPGTCLLARPEVDRPEVQLATAQHGLPPGSYFNSGVLVLDLGPDETLRRLDAAIAIAEGAPDRLVFQDQCALNIAFAGATGVLDECFNRYVPADADEATIRAAYATSGVFHYLDRPKPWDPMYGGPAGQLWLEQWQMASGFVPEAALRETLAEAFR
jgi:lipopolysaccharide biosynthesis glycosyltransferase